MKWKFDVGIPVQVPKLSGGYMPGMVMGRDANNRTYIVKQDDEDLASVWTKELFEQVAFVSQLSFKEQMMEESSFFRLTKAMNEIYESLFVQIDTEALHKKLDEMSERRSK